MMHLVWSHWCACTWRMRVSYFQFWVEEGLMKSAMGRLDAMCYNSGDGLSHLPVAEMVHFDGYSGPILADGTVSICPIRRTWSHSGSKC